MKVDFATQAAGSVAVPDDGTSFDALVAAYNKAKEHWPKGRTVAIVEVRLIAKQETPNGS